MSPTSRIILARKGNEENALETNNAPLPLKASICG